MTIQTNLELPAGELHRVNLFKNGFATSLVVYGSSAESVEGKIQTISKMGILEDKAYRSWR